MWSSESCNSQAAIFAGQRQYLYFSFILRLEYWSIPGTLNLLLCSQNNDKKSNLVSHVFIKNLPSVCTDKSTHRNVIQASKPPTSETYNEKKVNPRIYSALVFKQMHLRGLVGRSAKYPNRGKPFPSRRPLFQSEAKCEAIDMKISFILIQIKLIFQERSCTQPSNESERFWNTEIAPQQRSRPSVYLDYSLSIILSHY